MLLSDYVKVSKVSVEDMLYDEQDILRSMDKIEIVQTHQPRHIREKLFTDVIHSTISQDKYWASHPDE
ncbi:hypothetical protein CASFOL_041690 [Castilleja foliolosa]|uniref:Uncharacterized protein n=1 Tax=Castilleja foliolosa TaxID=1961234 RepID=A0ABD3BBF4_9LAMI